MRIHLRKATIFFLEIKASFSFGELEADGFSFEIQNKINPDNYLEVYQKIGELWHWSERLLMTEEKLEELLLAAENLIYFLKYQEEIIGYFELNIKETEAELVYFGLAENHLGRGLGRLMMDKVKAVAHEHKIQRLWLHTCSFDSPKALAFYKKSGFYLYKETTGWERHLF